MIFKLLLILLNNNNNIFKEDKMKTKVFILWDYTTTMFKVLYAFILLLSCAAYSQEKDEPLIPVPFDSSETGWNVRYKPPDIPQSILQILRENMKYENSLDPYYWIERELSEEGFNTYRLILAANAAIRTGNVELVQKIFKYYTNFIDSWARITIRSAAETGSLKMVKFLLDAGVTLDKNDHWFTDFSWFAAYCSNPDVIRFLIERGEDVNQTTDYCGNSVNHAAEHGRAENLRVLLAAGASIETLGMHDVTALMLAEKSGNEECVQILLEAGADIEVTDYRGNTALMAAAESGNPRSVRLLLGAGAGKNINTANAWGSTALIEAAINGSGETVQALIATGANVNGGTWKDGYYANTQWYLYSKGLTALMLASTADAVTALLAGGADVNIKDSSGHNAIYYQCFFYRNTETIIALIQAGSYLYLDVNRGRDLLRLSKSWSDWEQNDTIINMLEKAGCADDDPGGDLDRYGDYFHVDRH
jgi:ankyrin repeat protein